MLEPQLSVIVATYNNRPVLERCLASWERYAAGQPIEMIVVEDGCTDDTAEFLRARAETPWGRRHLRWVHEDNVHELRCTNRGLAETTAPLALSWHDDMFLQSARLVPELLATFRSYPEIGVLSLSRGLTCTPVDEPIVRWEDLSDWRRLQSTIGPPPWNWFRIQEVDAVMRPWVVRRACVESVGALDESFKLSEWDEADLCFRIRQSGWAVATHGYERLGYYRHLGSTTVGRSFTDAYKAQVLRNGLLFHERWDETIAATHDRRRRTWRRRVSALSLPVTLGAMTRFGSAELKRRLTQASGVVRDREAMTCP